MQAILNLDQHIAQIQLKGNFTWEGQREIKQVTQEVLANGAITELHFDLAEVERMDSAGLGMLLLLHERSAGRRIVLSNIPEPVRATLDVANTGGIFEMR
ncbi:MULTISPECIES: STAS domain-containing protein [Silvimonas]|uniref:STAS domain-containing protein n=1 Tax=Silvimonas TaxID=300264 RepID=UPI0024B3B239|nr:MULTISPECIES: STAS domain-containing protein [Silvimonas]MDR3428819.1 STAS domain-containing protein [Silvimonas sp.]